jgi:formylglycine-generating enzyme required for sulfatase activity
MSRARRSWRAAALACAAAAGGCDREASSVDAAVEPPPTGSCPAGMVFVEGGEFTMGSDDTTGLGADGSAAPAHRVRVSAYCLDETPVTAAAYARCVDAGRCPAPTLSAMPGCAFQGGGAVAPGFEASPMNCLSWDEAYGYCRAEVDGGALPTEAQWEFAATNRGTTRYPWGDDAPAEQLCWSLATVRGGVCPVAAHAANARGLRDMLGNVWVWTQDWFAPYGAGAITDPAGPTEARARTFRGASFGADRVGLLAPTLRGWNAPTHRVPQLGFRCARRPDAAHPG